MDNEFDDFLVTRNDILDSAVYQLMRKMLVLPEEASDDDPFPLNAHFTCEVLDYIEVLLKKNGHLVCYPFYDDAERTPCYRSGECPRETCPFKENHKEGEN